MPEDKSIHFGNFLRRLRSSSGKSVKDFAAEIQVSTVTLTDYEKRDQPRMHEHRLGLIAKAVDMELEEFNQAWQNTPVSAPLMRGHRAIDKRKTWTVQFPAAFRAAAEAKAPKGLTAEAFVTSVLRSLLNIPAENGELETAVRPDLKTADRPELKTGDRPDLDKSKMGWMPEPTPPAAQNVAKPKPPAADMNIEQAKKKTGKGRPGSGETG